MMLKLTGQQEDYLARYAANADDRTATEQAKISSKPDDPMEGLEDLDVAGPKPE